jgi:3-phenylpropionate/trans-cinnamate dioxygenase ferredoxin subunit
MMSESVRVCAVGDVEPGTVRRFDVGARAIAVARVGDEFYAIGDTCSHADFSLSEGEVDVDERTIECALHGSMFSLADGTPLTLPATMPVPVYTVEVNGDDVMVVIP